MMACSASVSACDCRLHDRGDGGDGEQQGHDGEQDEFEAQLHGAKSGLKCG